MVQKVNFVTYNFNCQNMARKKQEHKLGSIVPIVMKTISIDDNRTLNCPKRSTKLMKWPKISEMCINCINKHIIEVLN